MSGMNLIGLCLSFPKYKMYKVFSIQQVKRYIKDLKRCLRNII